MTPGLVILTRDLKTPLFLPSTKSLEKEENQLQPALGFQSGTGMLSKVGLLDRLLSTFRMKLQLSILVWLRSFKGKQKTYGRCAAW